jgi:2-methylcitrate dehydratase PrpD
MSVEKPEGHGIIGEKLGAWIADGQAPALPAQTVEIARLLLLDVTGLCISGRDEDYIHATLQATDPGGACTALGHADSFSAFDAALINGTAAHGEDYDDTFEGGPVHSGAVVVPAVLAACEREGLGGDAFGAELMCRLSLVAPRAIHTAGFHPTAVIGALAAAGGVAAALRLNAQQASSALGIAGSMAAGIIEYLPRARRPSGCTPDGPRSQAFARR